MSIRVMSAVWDHSKSQGASRLVMLAIADFCNDDGEAWPKVETLCHKCRISERNYRYCIKNLIDLGELKIDHQGGKHQANLFTILLPRGAMVAPLKTTKGGNPCTPGGQSLQSGKPLKSYANTSKQDAYIDKKTSEPSGTVSTLPTVEYSSAPQTEKCGPKMTAPGKPKETKEEKEERRKKIWKMLLRWEENYTRFFQSKYVRSVRDFKAIKLLIKTNLGEDHLFRIIEAAWKNKSNPRCFHCKNSSSLMGVYSKLNEIRDELNALKNISPQETGGAQGGEPAWRTEKKLRDEVQVAEANTHYDHDKTPEKLALLDKAKANLKNFLAKKQ